jgi:peptidoglycan hydrolase-like protein with peptidoglycan-binding domain
VKEAQSLLDKHGFACKPDGDFGPKTQEIVKQFQKAKGIPVTGDVDQPTWAALLA